MRKAFRHSVWIPVLLATGVLVTGCQSEKDRSEKKTSSVKAAEETAPPKAERAPPPAESPSVIERIFSPTPSKPATPPRKVTSTKSKHAKPTAHLKATSHAKPKAHAEAKTAADRQTSPAPIDASP